MMSMITLTCLSPLKDAFAIADVPSNGSVSPLKNDHNHSYDDCIGESTNEKRDDSYLNLDLDAEDYIGEVTDENNESKGYIKNEMVLIERSNDERGENDDDGKGGRIDDTIPASDNNVDTGDTDIEYKTSSTQERKGSLVKNSVSLPIKIQTGSRLAAADEGSEVIDGAKRSTQFRNYHRQPCILIS